MVSWKKIFGRRVYVYVCVCVCEEGLTTVPFQENHEMVHKLVIADNMN